MAGVEGRVALVTGAGRGIGRVTAELLAARGAHVMAVARNEEELSDLGLEFTVADLGTAQGCSHAVEQTSKRLGPVEIFVCNHGIGSAHERVIWEQDPALWEQTIRINLDGPFHLSRLITADMVKQGYGRVVYIFAIVPTMRTSFKRVLPTLNKPPRMRVWKFAMYRSHMGG